MSEDLAALDGVISECQALVLAGVGGNLTGVVGRLAAVVRALLSDREADDFRVYARTPSLAAMDPVPQADDDGEDADPRGGGGGEPGPAAVADVAAGGGDEGAERVPPGGGAAERADNLMAVAPPPSPDVEDSIAEKEARLTTLDSQVTSQEARLASLAEAVPKAVEKEIVNRVDSMAVHEMARLKSQWKAEHAAGSRGPE